MELTPHLTFRGQCGEAFRFYKELLSADTLTMLTYGDSPMADQVEPDWRDKIVHATLKFPGGTLAGVDVRPADYQAPNGFFVLLSTNDVSETRRIFDALAIGGTVQTPLQTTFWSAGFGVVIDRYGTPWELNCELPAPVPHNS